MGGQSRMQPAQSFDCLAVHHRVVEEAAGIAQHGRIGQLAAPDGFHRIGHLHGCQPRHRQGRSQLGIVQPGHEGAGQSQTHGQDQPVPAGRRLEEALPIAEGTFGSGEAPAFARLQMDGRDRIDPLAGLHAIGADVLPGGCAHPARNQCQVLQSVVALLQRPAHRVVPDLAGGHVQPHRVTLLFDHVPTTRAHQQHGFVQVTCQQQVAAAAQDQRTGEGLLIRRDLMGVRGTDFGCAFLAQQPQHLVHGRLVIQRAGQMRRGPDAEGVEGAKLQVVLNRIRHDLSPTR